MQRIFPFSGSRGGDPVRAFLERLARLAYERFSSVPIGRCDADLNDAIQAAATESLFGRAWAQSADRANTHGCSNVVVGAEDRALEIIADQCKMSTSVWLVYRQLRTIAKTRSRRREVKLAADAPGPSLFESSYVGPDENDDVDPLRLSLDAVASLGTSDADQEIDLEFALTIPSFYDEFHRRLSTRWLQNAGAAGCAVRLRTIQMVSHLMLSTTFGTPNRGLSTSDATCRRNLSRCRKYAPGHSELREFKDRAWQVVVGDAIVGAKLRSSS
jgi:hypothetical protein